MEIFLEHRIRSQTLLFAASAAGLLWFTYRTLVPAWTSQSTDFPNYYTAAKLACRGAPLHLLYEWRWFQREMNATGIQHQLGGYIPQTPLTMLPFIPLTGQSPAKARQIWLVLNCFFLALSLRLLCRMTKLTVVQLWLVALLAGDALRSNFVLGQYYVFLLALLVSAAYCILRRRDASAGVLLGAVFALKLYGGPLLVLAVVKRRWGIAAGFVAATAAAIGLAGVWFGWDEMGRYCAQVLPRSLLGETLNPYHPSNNTASTLLRRVFLKETDLNPAPAVASPFLFHLFQTAFALCVGMLTVLGSMRLPERLSKRILAWWLVAILLLSPNTASYTFVLLLLPVALLYDEMPFMHWILVLFGYAAVCIPLRPAWSWLFPRLWVLIALYIFIGYRELRAIPARHVTAVCAAALAVSAAAATAMALSAAHEPPRVAIRLAAEPGAIYSDSPIWPRSGILCESIAAGHYVLRQGSRTFALPGDSFRPTAPDSGSPVWFESVEGAQWRIIRLDPASGKSEEVRVGVDRPEQPAASHSGNGLAIVSHGHLYFFDGAKSRLLAISGEIRDASFVTGDDRIVFAWHRPEAYSIGVIGARGGAPKSIYQSANELASPSLSSDGRILLFAARRMANWQVHTLDLATGKESEITGGACNNMSPAWRAGSRQIVFASDCGRGLGLTALFTASSFDNAGHVVSKSADAEAALPFAAPVHR